MASENVPAEAFIGLVPCMDFGMAFEIVTAYKALAAVITLELAVTEVRLDVGFDVFFSAKSSPATWVNTDPFSVP